MSENRSEGLVVRAEPIELAERICERLVTDVRIMDGVLWLGVEPAWAGAVNTVLVKKGVRVTQLCCAQGFAACKTWQAVRKAGNSR